MRNPFDALESSEDTAALTASLGIGGTVEGGTGSRFWIADKSASARDMDGNPRPEGAAPQSIHFVTGCYTIGAARRYVRDYALDGYGIYDWRNAAWTE
jgi:hypothetical protein